MGTVNYKKASTYYLIGNIFNKGVAFLTVPVFTRILSTYDYGIVTTYNSWIAILSMIMGFALHTSIRMAYVDYKGEIDDFMSVSTFFTIITSSVMTAVVVLVALMFGMSGQILMFSLCMIQGFATAIIQDYIYFLMMKYDYRLKTALMILPNLVSIILSVFAITMIFETNKYMGRIIPTAIVTSLFAIWVIFLVFHKSRMFWNKEYLKYGLLISAPLIIHGIALNLLSQLDRIMITLLADASQTGIYSLIYNFSMIATVITTSLEGVWVPWFLLKMKEKGQEKIINIIAKDYINLMTYAMVSLLLTAPEIVKLMADKSYWEGIIIIPPVVLANFVIFIYTLYVNIEHYYKRTVYITCNTLIAAAVNLILNFIFIPEYGYIAAAYTTLASYMVSFVLHSIYAKKLEKNLYPISYFYRPLIHLMFSCVLFYLLMDRGGVRWGIMLIYVTAMLFRERERIFQVFPSIKMKLRR
jgi:O-antigen/teichoic acid export membrane protein